MAIQTDRAGAAAYSGINAAAAQTAPLPRAAGFAEAFGAAQIDLDEIFSRASAEYGVPLDLLRAVARAESGFNPNAVSRCGAVGVMQLMPGTARSLGVTDSYDPEQNIMGGAKYLRQMLDEFNGDTQLALAAYNAGPGAVKKYGGIPPYAETQGYVRTVTKYAGDSVMAGTARISRPAASATTISPSSSADAAAALKEMFMLKFLEMQMHDDDDDGSRKAV
ncbi:MAG: lytic transglycosylase domain-containing protein [Oscillospiraceae bacterium]|jgi:soluble lytic murein transglycosylase-like protein|nr:lytic transglycosylase domain-containing protein [Oscillospiraceae bacterium]